MMVSANLSGSPQPIRFDTLVPGPGTPAGVVVSNNGSAPSAAPQVGQTAREGNQLTETWLSSSDFYSPRRINNGVTDVVQGFQPLPTANTTPGLTPPRLIAQNANADNILNATNQLWASINTNSFGAGTTVPLNTAAPDAFAPAVPQLGINPKPLDILAAVNGAPIGPQATPSLSNARALALGSQVVGSPILGLPTSGSAAALGTAATGGLNTVFTLPVSTSGTVVTGVPSVGSTSPLSIVPTFTGIGIPVSSAVPTVAVSSAIPTGLPVFPTSTPLTVPTVAQQPIGVAPQVNPFPFGQNPGASTILASTTNFIDQLLFQQPTFSPGPQATVIADPFGGIRLVNPNDPQSAGIGLFYPSGFDQILATNFSNIPLSPFASGSITGLTNGLGTAVGGLGTTALGSPGFNGSSLGALPTVVPTSSLLGNLPLGTVGTPTTSPFFTPNLPNTSFQPTLVGFVGQTPVYVLQPVPLSTVGSLPFTQPSIATQPQLPTNTALSNASLDTLRPLPDFIPLNVSGGVPNFLTSWSQLSSTQRQQLAAQLVNPTTVNTAILSSTGITTTGGAFGQGVVSNPFTQPGFLTDQDPFGRTGSGILTLEGNGNGRVLGTPINDVLRGRQTGSNIINGQGGRDLIVGGASPDLISLAGGSQVASREGDDVLFYQRPPGPISTFAPPLISQVNGGPGTDTLVIPVAGNPTVATDLPTVQAQGGNGQGYSVTLGPLEQLLVSDVENLVFTDAAGNIGSRVTLTA